MPVQIQVWEVNGTSHWVDLPAQVWEKTDVHQLKVATTTPVLTVTIDPMQRLADEDRANNVWTGSGVKVNPVKLSANEVIDRYLEAIGGRKQAEKLQKLHLEYRNAVDSNFVVRQDYASGYEYGWTSAIENAKAVVSLKSVQQRDKLAYTNISLPVNLQMAEREGIRFSAHLIPELYLEEMGATITLSDSLHLVHGMETHLILLTSPRTGNTWKLYYDKETGLKVREEYVGRNKEILYVQKVLGDYQTVNGIKIPGVLILNEDGTRFETFKLKHFSTT